VLLGDLHCDWKIVGSFSGEENISFTFCEGLVSGGR
jgi:hypothetical protein